MGSIMPVEAHRPTPLNRRTQVSGRLDHIIMRSLEKAPHLRPSASEVTALLVYEILQRHGDGWRNWHQPLRKLYEA
jgi:hypothetical protein